MCLKLVVNMFFKENKLVEIVVVFSTNRKKLYKDARS